MNTRLALECLAPFPTCAAPVSHDEPRTWVSRSSLADVDAEDLVGVLVTPVPVLTAITFAKALEVFVAAVPVASPKAIGLIFAVVPMMVVLMVSIVIDAIVRAERCWQQAHRRDESGAKKRAI